MYREYLYIFYLVIIDTIYIYSKFKYLTLQCFCINYIIKTFNQKKNLKNTRKKGAVFIALSYGAFNLTFLRLYPSELWRVYFDHFALTLQF